MPDSAFDERAVMEESFHQDTGLHRPNTEGWQKLPEVVKTRCQKVWDYWVKIQDTLVKIHEVCDNAFIEDSAEECLEDIMRLCEEGRVFPEEEVCDTCNNSGLPCKDCNYTRTT